MTAQLNVDEKGNVTEVRIIKSSPQHVFDNAVIRALSQWKFPPEGEKWVGEIEIGFKLTD